MFKVKFTKIFLKDLKNVQEIKPHRMYLQSKNLTIKKHTTNKSGQVSSLITAKNRSTSVRTFCFIKLNNFKCY